MGKAGADVTDIAPGLAFPNRKHQVRQNRGGMLRGAVKPAITTSWRRAVLIFSQSLVRAPERYLLLLRLAIMPSRPCSSACLKNFDAMLRAVWAEGQERMLWQ